MDLGLVIPGAVVVLGGLNMHIRFVRLRRRNPARRDAFVQFVDSRWLIRMTAVIVLCGLIVIAIGAARG
jgi:hypothetical protein